jgi:hypothetical protein
MDDWEFLNDLHDATAEFVAVTKSKVHTVGCVKTCCPQQCGCRSFRSKPLDLHTAIVWDLVSYIDNIRYQMKKTIEDVLDDLIPEERCLEYIDTEGTIEYGWEEMEGRWYPYKVLLRFHLKKYKSVYAMVSLIHDATESAYRALHDTDKLQIDNIKELTKIIKRRQNLGGKKKNGISK